MPNGRNSDSEITNNLKIRLQIRFKGRNHNTTSGNISCSNFTHANRKFAVPRGPQSPQSSRVTATLREAGLRKNEAAFHATSAQTLRTAPLSTRRGHLCPCPPPPPGLQVSLCPHLHQSYGLSADGRGTVRPTLGRGGKAQRDIGVPSGRRLLLSTVNAASRVLTYV